MPRRARSPAALLARSALGRHARANVGARYRRTIATASEERLERLDGAAGRAVITALFRLFPLQFNRRAAGRTRAVVEWRITEADGGASLHTLIIEDGRCRVRTGVLAEPDLVLEVSAADFLRLTAGLADGTELFFAGRLRVQGDLGLAFRLPRMLRAPAGR